MYLLCLIFFFFFFHFMQVYLCVCVTKTIYQNTLVCIRWSKIAAQFPGRTDNEIKNHWNTRIKKKMKFLGLDPRTHHPIEQRHNVEPILKLENGESTSSHNIFNNDKIKEENSDISIGKTPTIEDIGYMMMSNDHQLESCTTSFELEFPQTWIDNPGFQWDAFNDPGLSFHFDSK